MLVANAVTKEQLAESRTGCIPQRHNAVDHTVADRQVDAVDLRQIQVRIHCHAVQRSTGSCRDNDAGPHVQCPA